MYMCFKDHEQYHADQANKAKRCKPGLNRDALPWKLLVPEECAAYARTIKCLAREKLRCKTKSGLEKALCMMEVSRYLGAACHRYHFTFSCKPRMGLCEL